MDTGSPQDLIAANRELRRQVKSLTRIQAQLSYRLERVENSVIFRCLRWLGDTALSVFAWIHGVLPFLRSPLAPSERDYLAWSKEADLMDLSLAAETAPSAALASIVLLAARPERPAMEKALESLRAQTHAAWELFVCSAPAPPDWLDQSLAAFGAHRAAVVSCETMERSLGAALDSCAGEFVLWMTPDVRLQPGALARMIGAASAGPAAVYSDWDHLDLEGVRHAPRFTPEFSPELLKSALYFGECFLTPIAAARAVDWSRSFHGADPAHALALQLEAQTTPVLRVPSMLWHRQTAVRMEPPPVKPAPAAPRASIVICSRNPAQLEKCLHSLGPAITNRAEVIAVTHHVEDGSRLDRIAESHGARPVPYRGPFHFGLMNQLGVDAAREPVLILLNDDVFPIAPDWLDRMAAQAARPHVGAVGALLLYPGGAIQHAGIVIGGLPGPTHVGRFVRESIFWPWLRMTREVSAVTGACLAIRRSVWDELGGFNRSFPVNYNDVDLCLRARQRGYSVLLEASAVLTHEESQTRRPAVRVEELALFVELWGEVLEAPDPFFHPELEVSARDIRLRSPWSRL